MNDVSLADATALRLPSTFNLPQGSRSGNPELWDGTASRYQILVSQFALQTRVGQWQLKNVKCDLEN